MKISARNRLKGKIVEVKKGTTTAHVRIDIGGQIVTAARLPTSRWTTSNWRPDRTPTR
jgi:molybdopterin-binding protein